MVNFLELGLFIFLMNGGVGTFFVGLFYFVAFLGLRILEVIIKIS